MGKTYCTHKNKLIHETVEEASKAADEMRETFPEYTWNFYTCWRCAKYHVGRRMTKRQKAQLSKEKKLKKRQVHNARVKREKNAKLRKQQIRDIMEIICQKRCKALNNVVN